MVHEEEVDWWRWRRRSAPFSLRHSSHSMLYMTPISPDFSWLSALVTSKRSIFMARVILSTTCPPFRINH